MRIKIKERIYIIEEEISSKISEKYVEEIVETLKELGGDEKNLNGSGRKKLWEILKKNYSKCKTQVPVGKKDKFGNIVTNHERTIFANLYAQVKKSPHETRFSKNEGIQR